MQRQNDLPAGRPPSLLDEDPQYYDTSSSGGDIQRAGYSIPAAHAHFPERAGQVPDVRRTNSVQPYRGDQLAYAHEARLHIYGQSVKLLVNRRIQRLHGPVNGYPHYSIYDILALRGSRCLDG